MNQYSENEKLTIFKNLFKGREDVFAVRWEKGPKSGYMPAYAYDPYLYRLHKIKGGTFASYADKTHLPLSDLQLQKHLTGEQHIGIYPLLQNNTSWFIAADFDKEKWISECYALMGVCRSHGIPAYLERSRSGNGGHVWVFFDQPYPAIKSRKIIISLMEESGISSGFDKNSSFDRLFPNQDFHSGKALGNLIALPLHKLSMEAGNSCFIDDNLTPYKDQWAFISSIQKVAISHFDTIYSSLPSIIFPSIGNTRIGELNIRLNNSIYITRAGMSLQFRNFIKNELNFTNSQYFIKKKSGNNTWGTNRYFNFIEEREQDIIIPRGFIGKLIRFCAQENINFKFTDERSKLSAIPYVTNLILRPHQKSALEATTRKEFGVISAPPGSGKTVIGLKIIADKQQPAIVIVHRKQLLDQWTERIESFLGIPKSEIGRIGQGKVRLGNRVTVAMIQSLTKHLDKQVTSDFARSFGTIIVDECHHVPAETFRNTISKLSSYYQYGLTATPFRKGNDGKIIFIHLGEIIAEIQQEEIENYKRARVIFRETTLNVPFNPKTDPFETLSKILVHDSARNRLIFEDITSELNKGKKAVVITERKEHIETLHQFLKQSFEVVTLSGDDSENSRNTKWKMLKNGNYQVLITTGQFFGEGTDLQNASCLFLVYPFSFKGKLIQYIGRVQRAEITPIIYDYRDRYIDYLDRLFLKRNTYYRHLDRQATLFEDSEDATGSSNIPITVDKKIKVSIDALDFLYGAIAFRYQVPGFKSEIVFEVENSEIRPEFDALKPYFIKVLGSKHIEAYIHIEIEDGILVAQSASSADLEKINRDIIESVKFKFISHVIGSQSNAPGVIENVLDIDMVQPNKSTKPFYSSEEHLLNDILKNETVKHYKHLRYLASNHDGKTLKLRFVLNPFSFLFLLHGTEQYHIVLETLDSAEATYMWHFDKNRADLLQSLKLIDEDINIIRNKGRKFFLENQPDNFSRIIHDYSNERKGFIIWRDQLEEKLY